LKTRLRHGIRLKGETQLAGLVEELGDSAHPVESFKITNRQHRYLAQSGNEASRLSG
jgi:hypothetical protein